MPLLPLLSCHLLREPEPISQALERCRTPPEHPRGQGDLAIAILEDSPARCNDGRSPVVCLRAACDPSHAKDWLVFLEGGAACATGRTCQERWCGSGHFTAAKMSSRFSKDHLQGEGILDGRSANPFAAHHVVTLNDCSSDLWTGNAAKPVELSLLTGSFTVYFQGHRIVEEVLDRLDAGLRSDDGSVRLTDAQRIVWTGSSAGGTGALMHLDLTTNRYRSADVRGVVDAGSGPDLAAFHGADRSEAEEVLKNDWATAWSGGWDTRIDPDCAKVGDRCANGMYLIRDAVQTPLGTRLDVRDPTNGDLGLKGDISMQACTAAGQESMVTLAKARPDLSALATHCAKHIVSESDTSFTLSVADAEKGGRSWSLNGAAGAFIEDRNRVGAIDGVQGVGSICSGGGPKEPGDQRPGEERARGEGRAPPASRGGDRQGRSGREGGGRGP